MTHMTRIVDGGTAIVPCHLTRPLRGELDLSDPSTSAKQARATPVQTSRADERTFDLVSEFQTLRTGSSTLLTGVRHSGSLVFEDDWAEAEAAD
jgi:hypothetical protein